MSEARKCDICDKYYDSNIFGENVAIVYSCVLRGEDRTVDCCPDCAAAINEFVKHRKMGKKPVYCVKEDENND